MICKTITYLDFNNEAHTEDFYFHLQQNEIVELEFTHKGGLGEFLQAMVKADDKASIMKSFKDFIGKGYGVRYGEKNEKFTKDPALIKELQKPTTSEFLDSNAYDVLFMELVTSEQAAIEFIIGVVPAEISKGLDTKAIKEAARNTIVVPGVDLYVPPMDQLRMPPGGVTPDVDKNIRPMTDEELAKQMEVPAAFRRPPVEQVTREERLIGPGEITLPKELQDLTRDEILAAYDRQMAKRRDDSPPEPPAA